MQEVLVILTFSAAVFFMGRLIYRQFFMKETKCKSCGLSNASDQTVV